MGGLTGAVHWWEEWQLRVLVLTSTAIQFFLLLFPILRRQAIPGWFRFVMWLAYYGGDAVAIYALATLFNRHKDQGDGSNTLLEVVWAPVLLIHLGGQDGVTAYNIEDNELWSRHLLTAVSQVTVAVYVFCKSWPPTGGDTRLLQTAILLFVIGALKCFMKAWAFKRASIYSLVRSTDTAANQTNDGSMYNRLEKYVKDARDIVIRQQPEDQLMEEEDPGTDAMMTLSKDEAAEGSSNHPRSRLRQERAEAMIQRQENKIRQSEEHVEASNKLFVDLSSSYPRRISILEEFWGLSEEIAYGSVQAGLASAFFLLYTKQKTALPTLLPRGILPLIAIFLFIISHTEAYNGTDVKVTYALLCSTFVLEYYSFLFLAIGMNNHPHRPNAWPKTVAQYSLVGYSVRNNKHNIKMGIVSFFQCKDFLDQLWSMEPCFSSARITHQVLRYLEDGWTQKIQDPATYLSFNNHISQWVLDMNRPFDECVLLWHLTTDFCFFSTSFPYHRCAFAEEPEIVIHGDTEMVPAGKCASIDQNPTSTTSRPQCSQESVECEAVQCRQMSNYMVYLLFVDPEMLLPGSRRDLFKTAYDELKGILKDWEWNPVCWSRCMSCGVNLMKEEAVVMKELNERMNKTGKRPSQEEATVTETAIPVMQEKSERSSQSMEGSDRDKRFIRQAWDLAQELLKKDEMEMWKEIQDVWVQMLCFSASRCRGYLHAKALGKGGEFLSYVWLLLFHMGMETFSERLQRELLPSCQGNFHNGAGASLASEVHTRAGASTTPSTSEIRQVAEDVV